jgi:hypothetical protein
MVRTFVLLMVMSIAVRSAAETVVTLERAGAPVANGEVCRFLARDRENPVRRWLHSQAVTCVAAGSAMTFPAGMWNVFGKVEGKWLSEPVLVEGSKAPPTLELTLGPAATLTPVVPAGKTAVFYAPRLGIAFPYVETMQRVTVPASVDLWAIVLEKSQPLSITSIPAVDPGTERAVDIQGSTGGPFVLGWLQVPEADRAALSKAQGVSSPRVRFTSGGSARDSDPLPPLAQLNGAFVLVRGVPAADGELDVAGRGWIPYRSRVKVDTHNVTVANSALVARAAASLFVSWGKGSDLMALDRELGSCGGGEGPAPRLAVSVAACAGEDDESCRVIHQETFDPEMPFGTFMVDDIPPGNYRAEMHFGKLPPIREDVKVLPLQQKRVDLYAQYETLYGGLTLGGSPLDEDANLKFPGDGVGFASHQSGEYRAVLLDMFDTDARIDVAACRGAFRAFALASRPSRRNARFDVDIPDNALEINVTDTFTRAPLDGATVRYSIMSTPLPRHPVVTGELKTHGEDGRQGRVVMKYVPEREVQLEVSQAGYQKQTIKPFTMPRRDIKTLDVELVPLHGFSGRIISPIPFDRGAVYWFSASGATTEHADLEPDGTFVYSGMHGPDETLAVISLSHPLWVARAPAMERHETFEVRFPAIAAREFDIRIPDVDRETSTYIGIYVGALRVPYAALRLHQSLRDLPSLVRGNATLHIRDLGETGPIDIVLGPTSADVPPRAGIPDPLALPQFATAPRKRLIPGVPMITLER